MREPINFSGKLNLVDAVLPDGDYTDARNVLITEGYDGYDGAIKLIADFALADQSMSTLTDPSVVTACVSSEGEIYALLANDTNGAIVRVTGTDAGQLTSYPLGSIDTNLIPDMVMVGSIIFWNYYGDGEVLSWDVNRTPSAITDINLIKASKLPPRNLEITVNTGTSLDVFSNGTYDFACRYIYDTGEYSVLSPHKTVVAEADLSRLNYGVDGIESVTLEVTDTHPAYARKIEFYARRNRGSWARIGTKNITGSTADISITFTGQQFETLSTEEAVKNFDAIPYTVKSLETSNNRLFLANIQDELPGDPITNTISIQGNSISLGGDSFSSSNENEPTKGNPSCYFPLDEGLALSTSQFRVAEDISASSTTYTREALWNDSTYYVGIALYDAHLRTRGVEVYEKFTTGMFDYPYRINQLGVNGGTSSLPSWAEYFQVVYTESVNKDFSVEGYASAILFIGQDEDGNFFYSAQGTEDITQVAIYSSVPYTFQEGDRVNLNTSKAENGSRVVNLKVIGSEPGVIYTEYDGSFGAINMDPHFNYFEVYSPKTETDNVVFKEVGEILPISDLSPSYTKSDPPIYDSYILKRNFPTNEASVSDVTTINFGTLAGVPIKYKTYVRSSDNANIPSAQVFVTTGKNGGEQEITATTEVDFDKRLLAAGTRVGYDASTEAVGSIKIDDTDDDVITGDPIVKASINVIKNINSGGTMPNYHLQIRVRTRLKSDDSLVTADDYTIFNGPADEVPDFVSKKVKLDSPSSTQYYTVTVRVALDVVGNGSTISIGQGSALSTYTDMNQSEGEPDLDFIKDNYGLCRLPNKRKNDFFTWDRPASKPLLEYQERDLQRNPNKIRWGGKYIFNSNLNPVSSFFFADQSETQIEAGEIVKLARTSQTSESGSVVLAICEREAASIYIDERVISNADGSTALTASDSVIGIIRPLRGRWGCVYGDRRSVVKTLNGNLYWYDSINDEVIRYSREGLTPLAETYKMGRINFTTDVIGFYDERMEMYFVGTSQGSEGNQMISFKERLGFTSYWDFLPDVTVQDAYEQTFLFKEDDAYTFQIGNGVGDYGNLETSTPSYYITARKTLPTPAYIQSLAVRGEGYLDFSTQNFIAADTFDITITNESGQSTTLDERLFTYDNGLMYAVIPFDENSSGGKWEGIRMFGVEHDFKIELVAPGAANSNKPIYYILLDYQPSPVN